MTDEHVHLPPSGAPARGMTSGRLLELIKSGPPLTRAQLSELTGFARTGLRSLVDPLIELGLVVEQEGASTGGRPPVQIAFNPQGGVVLAAELGRSHARLAVTDLAANVIDGVSGERRLDEGPDEILEWASDRFEELLQRSGRRLADVRGIGVGLPGPVEFASGQAIEPPLMPGWHALSVRDWLRERFGVRVLVDNDANVEGLGEYWLHHRHRTNDLLYVKAGTGIGGAIVAGGRLQRGALGGAGELGHLSVDDRASVRCRCGNYGCLEALAGGAAVVEQLRARGHELRDVRDVPALVREGVPDAVSAVRDAGRLLGTALASAVTLLNPSVVVVGGALSGCGEHLLVGVREVVYKHSMVLHLRELRVEVGRLGDQAGVIGASVNALDDVLSAHAIDGTDERPKLSTASS